MTAVVVRRSWPADPEARRRWEQDQNPAPPPHPMPEVPAREAEPHEIPAGAQRVRKRASEAGWRVSVTYARGTAMYVTGKPGGLVESIALRMVRGAEVLIAVWQRAPGGSWAQPTEGGCWRLVGGLPRRIGMSEAAQCAVCEQRGQLVASRFRTHGPRKQPCPGSGQPPESASAPGLKELIGEPLADLLGSC